MRHEQWLRELGWNPADGYRICNEIPAERVVPIILTEEAISKFAGARIVGEFRAYRSGVWETHVDATLPAESEAVVLAPRAAVAAEALALYRIMKTLRSETGCPWDRKQTHASLRRYLIEETYEVLDAIDRRDMELLQEELGDVLLQVVFHSELAAERGQFNFADVARGIAHKMTVRHPHVFGDADGRKVAFSDFDWEKQKKVHKKRQNILDGVPKGLPSLLLACKIQEKTARVGFDWSSVGPALEKLTEEWQEVREALSEESPTHLEEECGDVLFATVNVLRHLGVEPETALRRANAKYVERFHFIEERLRRMNKYWDTTTPEELNTYWNDAKAQLARRGVTGSPFE